MDKKIRKRLEKMLEEGNDLGKSIGVCMYAPHGIKVVPDELGEPHWFNRCDDPEVYDYLMEIYKIPNENGLIRYSHGVCGNHKNLIGTKPTSSSQ